MLSKIHARYANSSVTVEVRIVIHALQFKVFFKQFFANCTFQSVVGSVPRGGKINQGHFCDFRTHGSWYEKVIVVTQWIDMLLYLSIFTKTMKLHRRITINDRMH